VRAQLGKAKFAACAACHGPDGKGNQALGAPNLTDKVWLHGWGEQAIIADHQRRQGQRDAGAGQALTPSRSTCSRPTSGACPTTAKAVATALRQP
jgi:cytochrome c oxidase cbb3-type subunit 3